MFMVTPRSPRTRKESSIDVGMATPTKTEVRTPRKNSSTPTISSRPERMLFSRLLTIMRMSRDMSEGRLDHRRGRELRLHPGDDVAHGVGRLDDVLPRPLDHVGG